MPDKKKILESHFELKEAFIDNPCDACRWMDEVEQDQYPCNECKENGWLDSNEG